MRSQVLHDEVDQPEATRDADHEKVEHGATKGVILGHLSLLSKRGGVHYRIRILRDLVHPFVAVSDHMTPATR